MGDPKTTKQTKPTPKPKTAKSEIKKIAYCQKLTLHNTKFDGFFGDF
jgi:hypothetical protein